MHFPPLKFVRRSRITTELFFFDSYKNFSPLLSSSLCPYSHLNAFKSFTQLNLTILSFVLLQDWQPPFTLDVDKLRFTPRVQRINELEVSRED